MTPVSPPSPRPAAASILLDALLHRPTRLTEVARTRMSVHYETGAADVPVLCVALPEAVRLPNAVLTPVLPAGSLRVADGTLVSDDAWWQVTRWWRPSRPTGLTAPVGRRDRWTLDPHALVGAGEGLTPAGDDLLAAALVTAHATADPRLDTWRAATRDALRSRRTTAVSHALLWHALDGWCVPQLADVLEALCAGRDATAATDRLLAVGHSSGRALLDGLRLTLDSSPDTRSILNPSQGAA